VADRWRVGLGVTAPFGLETRWRYGTFPALSQSATVRLPPPYGRVTIPTASQPTVSKLEISDVAPTVAFKVNENLSLSAGLDIYWAKSAQLDSNLGSMEGDGTGVGFNLGFLYRINAFSLGASFNSGATLDLSGNYTAQNSTLVALRRIAPSQTASLDLDLPWRLQVGLRYELTKEIAAEFDWTYNGWSKFEELVVVGDQRGAVISREMNDWSNASAFRLGLTWQVRPTTQLRAGYSYDQTGQGDEFFSARVPDNDRQVFGLGVAQDLGRGFSIEASYMYVMAQQRNFRSATPYTATSGVNGTSALNGNYEMSANLIGIALNMTF
jgi:long-chain fatty acid transport protein